MRPAFWKGLVSDGRKDVNVVGCDYGVVSMANLGCYSPTSNRRPYRYTSCLDFNPQACIANVPGSKVPPFWNDCCTALEPVFSRGKKLPLADASSPASRRQAHQISPSLTSSAPSSKSKCPNLAIATPISDLLSSFN